MLLWSCWPWNIIQIALVHLQKMSSLVDKTTKARCKLMHQTNTGPNAITETSATHTVYNTISGNLLEINRFKLDDANNLLIVLFYTQFHKGGSVHMISSTLMCVVCVHIHLHSIIFVIRHHNGTHCGNLRLCFEDLLCTQKLSSGCSLA